MTKPFQVLSLTGTGFTEKKGFNDLLAVAELLKDEPIHFIVAGQGKPPKIPKGLKVTCCSNQNDEQVQDLLSGADLYLHLSHCEGLSMSMIEALKAGLPIIAYDVGGNREMVKETPRDGWSGINGFLETLGASPSVTAFWVGECIKIVERNPQVSQKLGTNSRRLYEEKFTSEQHVNELLRIYGGAE